jgi:hypothetical protein
MQSHVDGITCQAHAPGTTNTTVSETLCQKTNATYHLPVRPFSPKQVLVRPLFNDPRRLASMACPKNKDGIRLLDSSQSMSNRNDRQAPLSSQAFHSTLHHLF